jgi:hypothetical protein
MATPTPVRAAAPNSAAGDRAGRGHHQARHQRPPGRPPVGHRAAQRVSRQRGERDHRHDQAGQAIGKMPDLMCIDEQTGQGEPAANGGDEVAAEHDPRRARERRDE